MRITKFVLRLASIPVAILAIAMCFLAVVAGHQAVARVEFSDWVAAPILVGIVVLCIRVIVWLWSSEPFWRRASRTAEVTAITVLALLVPIIAHLESLVSGAARAALQWTGLAIPLVAYFAARRWHRRVGQVSPQHVETAR